MMRVSHRRLLAALLLGVAAAARGEEFRFDAAEFERKPYELGGWTELKQDHYALNPPGALYRLNYFGAPQRATLDATTGIVELTGKLRHEGATLDLHTHSDLRHDQFGTVRSHVMYEAALSLRASPGITAEVGKRTLRWGKGYAFNPIGFVERPKDPTDPDLAREGLVMVNADLIANFDGPLQTVALTPVLLPVNGRLNSGFGLPGHLNPTLKLYALYSDTDIDLAWQARGSRPARLGADFARNLTTNFEIHGEWARVLDAARPVTDAAGQVRTFTGNTTSWLFGARYLNEYDTTFIVEYYRNGGGYDGAQLRDFYRFADAALAQWQQSGNAAPVLKAIGLAQAAYGKPNPGRDYLYLRAQQKDAFGIVYFQPAVTVLANADDRSFQLAPELVYTGIANTELRLRAYLLGGGAGTDFGEKANARRIEAYVKVYF